MVGDYPVITLCGSTRFKEEFIEVQKKLTLEGNIVISVGHFGHSGDAEVWKNMDEGTLTKTKVMLDDMHKRKIDMADEIFVINVGGYIGDSTHSEIDYAIPLNKEAAKEASNQKKLSDREQAIYNLICENKHLTVEQVMAEFDISRATVFRDYAKIKKITGAVYDKNESVWKL